MTRVVIPLSIDSDDLVALTQHGELAFRVWLEPDGDGVKLGLSRPIGLRGEAWARLGVQKLTDPVETAPPLEPETVAVQGLMRSTLLALGWVEE